MSAPSAWSAQHNLAFHALHASSWEVSAFARSDARRRRIAGISAARRLLNAARHPALGAHDRALLLTAAAWCRGTIPTQERA